MKIRMPKVRAYYAASANEPDDLLCWIPADELARLVEQAKAEPDVLEYHPDGLEVEVSEQGLEEHGLELGARPEALRRAYRALKKAHTLPESGMVEATSLESIAQEAVPGSSFDADRRLVLLGPDGKLPGPEMTDGADARSVMQQL
jgi:hypothetical protein